MTKGTACLLLASLSGISFLTLQAGLKAKRFFFQRSSPPPVEARRNLPVRRTHEVVQPRRLDAWKIIGPGGGGTFYHPAISPHDPNLVFATTDMTQCFVSENGGASWRQFNLRFTCRFSFDPKRPDTIYALAVGAGLWRTDDRAHTWSLVYPDPATVAALWYLDDEGEASIQSTVGFPSPMTAFTVDPEDSDTVYAVVPPDLRISHDAGRHWTILAATGINAQTIYVDPQSPRGNRKLYLVGGAITGVWDGAKYSGDLKVDGSTWFYGSAFGTPAGGGKSVLYTANDYVLQNGVRKGGGIVATEDGGFTWRSLNDGLLRLVQPGSYPEFSAIATSLHHPEVIYVSFYHWHPVNDPATYFGVAKSIDGGKIWKVVRAESGVTAGNMHDSWISDRFGPDFGDQPLNITVDADNPNLIYTSDLGRLMRSADGGATWDAVYSQGAANGYTTTGLDVTTCYGIHFDPFDPKRMFISYTDIGLFRSIDGGESWMSATVNGVPKDWRNTTYWVEFDPAIKGKMWAAMSRTHDLPRIRMFLNPGSTAGMQGGVVASADGGDTWTVSSRGLPQMAATHILLDPRSSPSARVLYVTGFGRGVFKSTDGGRSWTSKNRGIPGGEPLTWRMALAPDGVLYVVTIRRSQDDSYGNDRDGALYRSRDGAESWERVVLPEGLNGPTGITVDPKDPGRLYLSAWGRYKLYASGKPAAQGGVFLSTDGGRHWSNTLDANRRIYDVTVDPRNPQLVYATGFESSAWRSADRGQTWKRIGGYNFKDGHRIIPDPADPDKIYITTFGSSVWHGPAAGDPGSVEDIAGPPAMKFQHP
jgi:photosystem II stability/assembly factor-like uncharacterized protein